MSVALVRLPIARLTRAPRAWLPVAGWCALSILMAVLERTRGTTAGADAVLLGVFGSIALPFIAFSVVTAMTGGASLIESGRGVVALGAQPQRVAAFTVGCAVATSALVCGLLAVLLVPLAGAAGNAATDTASSAWIVALGAGAYAAAFAAGATVGPRGGGRAAALVIDWMLGSGSGAGALLVPRGHVRNLLGGAPPYDIAQWKSAVALAVMIALFAAVASRRTSR